MSLPVSAEHADIKLSFCISTLNRAKFIGTMLQSIIEQATSECEIVVVDAASSDNTLQVVAEYASRFAGLRYFRQEINNGLDQDFDHSVELARGRYCWLLPDDDALKPGAVDTVLREIGRDYSLIVVNADAKDARMGKVVLNRAVDINTNLVFGSTNANELFETAWKVMGYIGCVIIRRDIWLSRERAAYYGSWLIHVAVIFQRPLPSDTLVVASPLVSVRIGTQSWLDRQFDVLMVRIPSLFRVLPLSEEAKRKATYVEPWRHLFQMVYLRGIGSFSLAEYRQSIRPYVRSRGQAMILRLIALLPGTIVNTYLLLHYSLVPRSGTRRIYLKASRYYVLRKR